MDKFLIEGPCKLKGKVLISGSKNAALPILAATLLFDKSVTIKNLPRVRDINTMINLLRSLGSKINDQSRVSDASEALRMGASKLVIGRAITQSNDSAYMFKSFCDKISI